MPERRVLRPGAAVVATLALLVTLTACVGIPNSGPVVVGLSLSAGSGGSNFEFNPEGPEKGAGQQKILTGFVASFTSATGGYAVAKQFLSADFKDKWDPRQSVQVRTGAPKIIQLSETTIDYSFSTIATVDLSGAYKEGAQSTTLQFGFVREAGQWRISAAPAGIVLADQTFQRIFSQHALYFLDQTNDHLVPDLRWFPRGTAVTRIVSSVVLGPPAWLKGAAFSRFPDGTQLSATGSVVGTAGGVAKVDLTKEALAATPKERQLMRLQLSESLRSVSSISSVSLSVEGTPLQIDDFGPSAPQADRKVDSQALVLRKGEFGFYANNKIAALSQLSSKVVALNPKAATLASDQSTVAVLGSAGVSVARKGSALAPPLDTRGGLIAPSLDEYGYLWSVPTGNPNAITVFDVTGAPHDVAPSLPVDSLIRSLEVSREGSRVTILLATTAGPRLIVAAILRDQKQVPVSLGPPIVDISLSGGNAIDATWVDQWTVATLVTVDGQSKVELFTVGGQRVSLGSPLASATAIVGGNNGQDGLRVLGNDSAIWAYSGSSWQSSKVTVDFIATQR